MEAQAATFAMSREIAISVFGPHPAEETRGLGRRESARLCNRLVTTATISLYGQRMVLRTANPPDTSSSDSLRRLDGLQPNIREFGQR